MFAIFRFHFSKWESSSFGSAGRLSVELTNTRLLSPSLPRFLAYIEPLSLSPQLAHVRRRFDELLHRFVVRVVVPNIGEHVLYQVHSLLRVHRICWRVSPSGPDQQPRRRQKQPTFRCVLPSRHATGRPHTDSEYYHQVPSTARVPGSLVTPPPSPSAPPTIRRADPTAGGRRRR